MIVTLDGVDGSSRESANFTQPIFAMNTRSYSTRNPLAVNLADCFPENRDLNRGNPIFGPLRRPVAELKKFWNACSASRIDWMSATEETSFSHGLRDRS